MPDDIAIPILGQTSRSLNDRGPSDQIPNPIDRGDLDPRSVEPIRHLYIHIPFCFHKCHYCDFYSIVDRRGRQEAFTARLIDELRALAPLTRGEPLRTIFVGGGTPTLLRPELWAQLLDALHEAFDLGLIAAGRGEFTVECNPETASDELFETLVVGGVDRLSIGAQSFDPAMLAVLERWHDPASVPRAVAMARAAGIGRVSLDLIFAIPGQTAAMCQRDLDRALALQPEHLSCYALTYEPGTPMTVRRDRGQFAQADEDLEADLYESIVATLADAGFARYETSNFARPGQVCAHNLAYWRQADWLAAGPSASAHIAGHRWSNVPHLGAYLGSSGLAPVVNWEQPDPARALAERLMTGLRLAEGVDARAMLDRARALGADRQLEAAVEAQRDLGHLLVSEGRWVLSDRGMLLADGIASELMAVL